MNEPTIEELQAKADQLWEHYMESSRETSVRLAQWTLANQEATRARMSATKPKEETK